MKTPHPAAEDQLIFEAMFPARELGDGDRIASRLEELCADHVGELRAEFPSMPAAPPERRERALVLREELRELCLTAWDERDVVRV